MVRLDSTNDATVCDRNNRFSCLWCYIVVDTQPGISVCNLKLRRDFCEPTEGRRAIFWKHWMSESQFAAASLAHYLKSTTSRIDHYSLDKSPGYFYSCWSAWYHLSHLVFFIVGGCHQSPRRVTMMARVRDNRERVSAPRDVISIHGVGRRANNSVWGPLSDDTRPFLVGVERQTHTTMFLGRLFLDIAI